MPTRVIVFMLTMTLAAGCSSPPPADGERIVRDTALSIRLRASAEPHPLVVGHRGDPRQAPENTLESFRGALAAGADIVEFDVRQTADDQLVCIHDRTVDRTTDGARALGRDGATVGSLTAERIGQLDAGSWLAAEHASARVPTLAAALDVILAGAVPMIEHKDGEPARYVDLLRDRGDIDKVLVQSFDWDWLTEVRALAPELTLGALGDRRLTDERLDLLAAMDVQLVHWKIDHLSVEDIARLQRRGYVVCVYTANADAALVGGAKIGLDAITTDRPGRLRELIQLGSATRH
jgi:glycerophosphoryl diester phosphodiesterase